MDNNLKTALAAAYEFERQTQAYEECAAQFVRSLRDSLTQGEIAARAKTTRPHICRIMGNGMTPDKLRKLARRLISPPKK